MSKVFDKVWHEGLIYKMKCFGINGMSLKLLHNFSENRLQRVLLNGQISSWEPVLTGVPQGSKLGPLLFLIYINDLSKDLSSVKLFADDTSIFSTVQDIKHSTHQLWELDLISIWVHQWKMLFNPNPQKQAKGVIFSRKTIQAPHLSVVFNNVPVVQSSCQKHLGVYLDQKLNFTHHIKEKLTKANKGIAVIKKLQTKLPQNALLTQGIIQEFNLGVASHVSITL